CQMPNAKLTYFAAATTFAGSRTGEAMTSWLASCSPRRSDIHHGVAACPLCAWAGVASAAPRGADAGLLFSIINHRSPRIDHRGLHNHQPHVLPCFQYGIHEIFEPLQRHAAVASYARRGA